MVAKNQILVGIKLSWYLAVLCFGTDKSLCCTMRELSKTQPFTTKSQSQQKTSVNQAVSEIC